MAKGTPIPQLSPQTLQSLSRNADHEKPLPFPDRLRDIWAQALHRFSQRQIRFSSPQDVKVFGIMRGNERFPFLLPSQHGKPYRALLGLRSNFFPLHKLIFQVTSELWIPSSRMQSPSPFPL